MVIWIGRYGVGILYMLDNLSHVAECIKYSNGSSKRDVRSSIWGAYASCIRITMEISAAS